MSIETAAISAAELLKMPRTGRQYELVRGELKTMSPAGFEHGCLVANITEPLRRFVRQNKLGVVVGAETGFWLARDPDTVRAPDVAFVARHRVPPATERQSYFSGAPDLAVEIISPHDTLYEVEEKVAAWLDAGCGEVWVVNPKRQTLAVHKANEAISVLHASEQLVGSGLLPGFSLSITAIFEWE